ncbi:hypothetical protein ACFFJY_19645 [Fictibacillus aquaticus]|uniref:Uncharacterized protein n=1 Tax=Fictibacillus aquaticus TaxID=2021314 RepID=A0A235F590_9BACL|nr:hypothetical protein [Fictibacillus aquaticus]OYD56388.1 hypothetical protein CGZ90_17700 [Fictibacillus aquaticus]
MNKIFKNIKDNGPKALKFMKDNGKDIVAGASAFHSAGKFVKNVFNREGDVHFRKARYRVYNLEILPNMNEKSRHELFSYKLEVEGYIEQIEKEENIKLVVTKPLHLKRTRNWENILLQIQDKIRLLDYQEYLRIFNNTNYNSNYFKGFESNVTRFKQKLEQGNYDELYEFIEQQTQKRKEYIKKHFC